MMKKDMVHSFMPAPDSVVRVEDFITEAAPVRSRRIHFAEMGQAVKDPFPVVGIRKVLETI